MHVPVFHFLGKRIKPFRRRLRARYLTRIGRREDAVVLLARIVPGNFWQDEIRLLYRTVRALEGPGDIAEIGSWKGRTSVTMGLALKDARCEQRKIWAIDHHCGSEEQQDRIAREGSTLPAFRRNIRNAGVASRIEPVVVRSVDGARILHDRGVCLRMVFIDGAHDEDSVRQDIRAFVPLLEPDGILAFHDCEPNGGFPGVWRAYRSEIAPQVKERGRASSLLVTQLQNLAPGPTESG